MRPAGEVRHALLKAAHELRELGEQATLRNLAFRAQVGIKDATSTVKNMRRAGLLAVVGECPVDYRNKPVALYEPAKANDQAPAYVDLNNVFLAWNH